MRYPKAFAATAAPTAVLPDDGTINSGVRPALLKDSRRCVAPRILKHPDGAKNSHLAKTSPSGNRLPRRIRGVRERVSMADEDHMPMRATGREANVMKGWLNMNVCI